MNCEKKKALDGNCCVGSGFSRLNVNIWEPQFDQSTFLGRYRHFYKLYHPAHFFASERRLENSMKIMERYRCGDPMDDITINQLWRAKYLYESTFDHYTNEKLFLFGRPAGYVPWTAFFAGGMLTYYQRPIPIVFWQWAYQTMQFAVNYTGRRVNSRITDEHLLAGYCAGTLGAVTTALLYHKTFKCSAPIISRMGPAIAAIVGTCISVPVTRYNDIMDGIPIYDGKEKKLAISTIAAKFSVLMQTAKQILIIAPPLVLAPFYMEYLEDRGTLCRYPYLRLPNQMLFLAFFCTFLTPFSRAIFGEKGSISFESLQPELQDCIIERGARPVPERVFFNLGL